MLNKVSALLFVFLNTAIFCFSQNSSVPMRRVNSANFLSLTPNKPLLISKENTSHRNGVVSISFGLQKEQDHLNTGQRLCVVGTLSLLVAAEIAYKNNNKDLALGFVSAGIITSSVGLVWYIRTQKRK